MKTAFLTLIQLLLFTVQAQTVKTVRFDFNTKQFNEADLAALATGDHFQIVVNNINQRLWKVVIDYKDTGYSPRIEFPSFEDMNMGTIPEILGKLRSGSTIAPANVNEKGGRNPDSTLFYDPEEMIETIEYTLSSFYDIKDEFERIQEALNIIYIQANKNDTFALPAFDGNSLTQVFFKLSALEKALNLAYFKYVKENTPVYYQIIKDDANRTTDSLIRVGYQYSKSLIDTALSRVSSDKRKEVLIYIQHLRNLDGAFTSPSLFMQSDRSYINLRIEPTPNNSNSPAYESKVGVPLFPKFYFSTGLGLYYSNLRNRDYSVRDETTPGDTAFSFVQERAKYGEIGIKSTLSMGLRIWRSNYAHLEVGPALSLTKDVRVRAVLGVGTSHGIRHKVNWNVGLIAGNTDRMSRSYNRRRTYSEVPNEYMVSALDLGYYLSIGYSYTW